MANWRILAFGAALLLMCGCATDAPEAGMEGGTLNESGSPAPQERSEALDNWDIPALKAEGRPVYCHWEWDRPHPNGGIYAVDLYILGDSAYDNVTIISGGSSTNMPVRIVHEDRYYVNSIDSAHEGCDWIFVDLLVAEECIGGWAELRESVTIIPDFDVPRGGCKYAQFGEEVFLVEGNICEATYDVDEEAWNCDWSMPSP
jgi:hypothetical protein